MRKFILTIVSFSFIFCIGYAAKKTKKKTNFTVKESNFWQYFTRKDKQEAYKYDYRGNPIYPGDPKKSVKEKQRFQKLWKEKVLERKAQSSGLSKEFTSTQDSKLSFEKVSDTDVRKSVKRLGRKATPVKDKPAKKPEVKKTPSKESFKVGPYAED